MSIIVELKDVTKKFAGVTALKNVSLNVRKGEVVGLIGDNGAGKSTLIKTLVGVHAPDSGSIEIHGELVEKWNALKAREAGIETVFQDKALCPQQSIVWNIFMGKELTYPFGFVRQKEQIAVANRLIREIGFTSELIDAESPVGNLSGGERQGVAIARAIFNEAELIVLDEPTNNLDINTIRWLEDTLNSRKSTMIVISHDRRFLNSVCTHMADLDYGEIRLYSGNYDDFMIASTQARERLISDNAKKQAKINELQAFVKRFSANASKAKQATSRANQINKIKLDDIKNSSRVYPFIRFNQGRKVHNKVLEVENIFKSYGALNVI